MGYWPSKLCALLNIVIMLGYGMIDCLVGGQLLSAVADGQLTVVVGIIINAVITWVVVVFGMSIFHLYERYVSAIFTTSTGHCIDQSMLGGHGYRN